MQNDCFPEAVTVWPKASVSSLAQQNPRYPLKGGKEYPFIEMASVAENCRGILQIDTRKLEGSGLSRFKVNDTLFAKITPCPENGKVAFVDSLPDEFGIGSTEFIVLSPRNGTDPRFLYHLLCSHAVRGRATARMEGSTGRQRVPEDVFDRRLLVPIPNPDEQTAIARILDAVDVAIERAREALRKAKDLDHSLLHELIEPRTGAHKSKTAAQWPLKRVDEVAEVGSGLTLGKDVTGFKNVDLPYLRVANVQDGHLDLSTIKTVRVRLDEVDQYRLEAGDVLMTEGGDLDKLGRGALWEGQIPDCLHQNHIFRVRANRALLDPRFFSYVVESDIAKRYFMRVAKRTTNLASTNKTQVRAFRFPVPPLDEQQQIAEIVQAAKAKIRALEQKEQALQQLKQSLLHDLLTGTVRVGDAGIAPTP
ncbi:restriction endonuclease subunit S [Thiobaca trueperi]|uniref:Type I restriction enzyme S subunit n=1 Tax=Thiobaca trueperi TaxID=127458 RepID=A0A4R3MXY2_9GAMM|nr:restriction endonuclease subunit S [Thiobaca trueperi]TCT21205.1 type I restriction enzyme S subunit [Thiobaca trueperi]